MYARLTTVEFDNAAHRTAALKLMSDQIERIRAMRGFEAAYFLDVDELRIISVVVFVTLKELQEIRDEDEALRESLAQIGVTFPHTQECRVMAFASEA
jgi:hypothetical protein